MVEIGWKCQFLIEIGWNLVEIGSNWVEIDVKCLFWIKVGWNLFEFYVKCQFWVEIGGFFSKNMG